MYSISMGGLNMKCRYCGEAVERNIEHQYVYCENCDTGYDPDDVVENDVLITFHVIKVICYTADETIEDAIVNRNGVIDIYLDNKCFDSGMCIVDKYNPIDKVDTMLGVLRSIGHDAIVQWIIDHNDIYEPIAYDYDELKVGEQFD